MFEEPDQSKLRNLTLVFGTILLSLAFANVQIDLTKSITLFGIPLKVDNTFMISYSLVTISLYFLFRYWAYAMNGRSPWTIRKVMGARFKMIDGKFCAEFPSEKSAYDQLEQFYHSGSTCSDFEMASSESTWNIRIADYKRYSFWTFVKDFDFFLPVIINVIGISLTVKNIVCS